MGSIVVMVVIGVCAGWIVWRRQQRRHASTAASSEGMPREQSALHAFAHGNTCLAEGKFAEAITAFQQALEREPKHPHVAGRLAEVERQQQAASAVALAK